MKDTLNVRRYWAALVVALTLVIGIFIGVLLSHGGRTGRVLPLAADARPLAVPSPVSLSNSFARIASKVTPAVVNINTESTIRFSAKGPQGTDGGLFNHFFRMGPEGVPREMQQQSLGSGVILDKNGFILTNYHVIMQDDGQPVDTIRVHLQDSDADRRGYRAKVVGYDKWTDLAVIKIDAGKSLPFAVLGDSDATRVGDWVLAIGSPFGLNATVTAGIISAKGREINGSLDDEFKRFLQTDAVINPGNSGGPLVSLSGQVIGINTEIATSRGVYDGVGFAIPSSIVRKVYNSIVTTGGVRRGAIGITFSSLQTAALLHSFGADHGVVVEGVEANGPAASAGLELGDVITAIDSRPVHSGNELLGIVSNSAPGQKLRIDFLRDGKPQSCNLTVGDWSKVVEAETNTAPGPPEPFAGPELPRSGGLGLSVRNLNPEEAKSIAARLHLASPGGVQIERVRPGSFADDLGLERSDVILSMNHKAVHSVADFNQLKAQLKSGQDVLFLVARRNGGGYSTLFFANPLP
ncbi:MAG: trypsin-like peptidase domain-containing protein [Terriglobia bacterium]